MEEATTTVTEEALPPKEEEAESPEPVPSDEAAEPSEAAKPAEAAEAESSEDFAKGYMGKYDWDETLPAAKAPADELGAKIVDYAWSDGKKKVSVYVTLDGLDDLPDDALETSSEAAKVNFSATFPSGKRWMELAPTFGEVAGVKVLRKMGKNMVVLKLEKKKENEWYDLLKPAGMAGGFADDDDDVDLEQGEGDTLGDEDDGDYGEGDDDDGEGDDDDEGDDNKGTATVEEAIADATKKAEEEEEQDNKPDLELVD